jgi:hypothetical protein
MRLAVRPARASLKVQRVVADPAMCQTATAASLADTRDGRSVEVGSIEEHERAQLFAGISDAAVG